MTASQHWLPLLVTTFLLVSSFAFGVDATGAAPSPVPFEGTNEAGYADVVLNEARSTDAVIPRAEAYFAEYPYVAGYSGIRFLIADLHAFDREREFGRIVKAYVSDFSGSGVHLDDDETLVAESARTDDWVSAEEAFFVVDSRAQAPNGKPVLVPFSSRTAARQFADLSNGTVVEWGSVRQRRYRELHRTKAEWERAVSSHQRRANQTGRNTTVVLDRRVSVVVGRNVPTLSAAIRRAPPGTSVRVPPGTYNVTSLRITQPLSIVGAGPNQTIVRGDGVDHVFNVTSERVGIAGVRITGVGTNASTARPLVSPSHRFANIRSTYGRAAAGTAFTRTPNSLVSRVAIESNATGVLVRESSGVVIRDSVIYGPSQATNDSIGISAIASRTVVEDTRLYGFFHSLIVHNTTGFVVRDSYVEGAVTGFHGMYASRSMIANSTFRDFFKPIMTATESSGNVAVENDVRNTALGIDFAGSRSYVAKNVLAHNGIGLYVEGRRTLYTENVLGYNRDGARVANPFPTNRITRNDFVKNDRHVNAQDENVRFVWTGESEGNYWGGFDRFDRDGDGEYDSLLRPTSTSGRLAYQAPGGASLVRSGAVVLLRALQTNVPGLRSGGVIDTAPRTTPAQPKQVARLRRRYGTTGQYNPSHDDDPYDYRAPFDVENCPIDTYG